MFLVVDVSSFFFFFFQAEDGIRDDLVTGVQTCALPILNIDTIILHAGTWTSVNGGNLPTCAQVNCDSAVTTITNGLITSFGSYLVGGQLTYQCNAGMYT